MKIHVDGRAHEIAPGQNLLEACLGLGYHLPFFCWHPALGSVGACRQCAIKLYKDEADQRAGHGRLVMSCMTSADDGARLSLASPDVVDFRKGVIEGMMLHHPHDCPVCDEGGHCHLQDMTVMTGHNYRRYRFHKRTWRNQYLGPLINHEMNRCIQCYRCVRFYREYAGGRDFDAQGIRDLVFFGRRADGVLESEFSGNLAEVCPTGVFTDATLKRQYTRKWDLRWAPSICPHCSLGCNISPGERYGQVRTVLNRYHADVNQYFLCDRGRYGHGYLESPQRLRVPLWQGREASPDTALKQLAGLLAAARADPPGRILAVGSPRASLETNFALRELAGPGRFYAGLRAGELALARRILALARQWPGPSLRTVETTCDAVFILGEDVPNVAARLALSLRQSLRLQPLRDISDPLHIPRWLDHAAREATQEARGPLFLATPAPTRLDELAAACHRGAPADLARLGYAVAHALDPSKVPLQPDAPEWTSAAAPIARALQDAQRPLIIAGMSCGSPELVEAAAAIRAALGSHAAELCLLTPDCNTLGLALLDPLPLEDGLEMARHTDLAIVAECDLFRCAPPAAAARFCDHYRDGRHLIVFDEIRHATVERAALLLPAAGVFHGDGTLVSQESRAQRFFRVFEPNPSIREPWRWLAQALGHDPTLDETDAELAAAHPELAAIRAAAPPASFRRAGQKIAQETHRFSGRTAIDAAIAVSEPKPPDDPDSALSYTMEGYPSIPPAALTPYFWSPGWNSPQAALTYQDGVNGPLRGGDQGVRLFTSPVAAEPSAPAPPAFEKRPGWLLAVRLYHLFGSEPLSQLAPALAQLAPSVYVALNPADAAAAGLQAGQLAHIQLDGVAYGAATRIIPELPAGVCGLPAGFVAFDGFALPLWCKVGAAC